MENKEIEKENETDLALSHIKQDTESALEAFCSALETSPDKAWADAYNAFCLSGNKHFMNRGRVASKS